MTDPNCHLCPLQGAKIIHGSGPTNPELMIIGEAPVEMEVRANEPFVGPSGTLLRDILRQAGFDDKQVYYTNVCMCKPPNNRTPSLAEVRACRDRLLSEISEVNPQKLLLCGTTARDALLDKTAKNGVWTEVSGIPAIVTVHPAFCLRQPDTVNDLGNHIGKVKKGYKKFPPPKWVVVDQIPQFDDVHDIYIDLETTGLNPRKDKLLWVGVIVNDQPTVFITKQLDEHVLAWLADPKVRVTIHFADFDAGWIQQNYGVRVTNIRCTMLMHYAIDGRTGEEGALRNLKKLCREYLDAPSWEEGIDARNLEKLPVEKVHEYLAHDVWGMYLLARELEEELHEVGTHRAYYGVMSPAIGTLARMSNTGVLADIEHLHKLREKYQIASIEAGSKLQDIVGDDSFNPGSPLQVAKILYDEFRLPMVNKRSTDKLTIPLLLEKLNEDQVEERAFLEQLQEFRFNTKFLSTYVVGLLDKIESDGRIHTHFLIPGTVTGRLSSRNPNLQNVPARAGPDIRNVFIADDDWMFADNDYSQLEVRVAAHVSADPYLTGVFMRDEDIHRAVGAVLYGIPAEEVTDDQRSRAKNVGTFGTLYGISLQGLMRKLGLTNIERAKDTYAFAKQQFAGLNKWADEQKAHAVNEGYVESMFGRRRWFPVITKQNQEEIFRQAVNAPIQASASDICLLSAVKIDNQLSAGVKLLILVHDSIVSLVRTKDEGLWIKEQMEQIPFTSDVPFKVECKMGQRWGEVKKIT